MYSSQEKLSTRGPYFSEDDHTPLDIVDYSIDASLEPAREWIDGKATLLVTPRRGAISTLVLTLAEPLVVRSVTSRQLGYLLALRVRGHNDVIINLPQPLLQGQLLDLQLTYSGRLPTVAPEREVMSMQINDTYRARWSPATSTRVAPAGTRKPRSATTRRPQCGCACRRAFRRSRAACSRRGTPSSCPPMARTGPWKEYHFSATQPVRYLAWATSRFVHVDSAEFSITPPEDAAPLARRGLHLWRTTRRIQRHVAAPGARGVRRGATHDEVLRFAPRRRPLSELHGGAGRARAAGRSQPAVLRGAEPPAAGDANCVARRSRVFQQLPRVLSRARGGAPVVGAGCWMEELPRAVDQ